MTTKAKTGRKTKYNMQMHVPWARSLAICGKTSDEIARELGIARSTLYGWMGAHPEFSDAIKNGKARADAEVVESLFNRATGRVMRTIKKKRETLDSAGNKITLMELIQETPPPDTTAMIYWLKNRQPELWRDRPAQAVDDSEADKFLRAWRDG